MKPIKEKKTPGINASYLSLVLILKLFKKANLQGVCEDTIMINNVG